MKRIIVLFITLISVLCLSSCKAEPPGPDSAFISDFSVTDGDMDYSGSVELNESGMTISLNEPYTVSGMSFTYNVDGMSISRGGLSAKANSDYIPSRAVPSVLHDALSYLSQAEYQSTEDGEDIYTLPTPYGEAELTAENGRIRSMKVPYAALEFDFSNR